MTTLVTAEDLNTSRDLLTFDQEKINLIKAHVKETGETAEVEGASISIRNGYTRVSWDSKALAGFAVVHPEINEFKTVREIGPSVTIKVN